MNLVIENARIVDPSSASVIERGFLAISEGKISALAEGSFSGSAAARVDGQGCTVLPGLIDAHVHLASFADSPDQILRGVTPETIAESTLRGAASARIMLEAGVTSARDLGCKHPGIFALKESIARAETAGPRLIVAGAGITMTGGGAYRSSAIETDGPVAIRHRVREQVRAGADVIKIFVSGGVLHASSTIEGVQYREDEIQAAVEEAHILGRPVAAHACTEAAIDAAVNGGVDTIEHGHEISARTAEAMAARGTYLVPTVWHYQRVASNGQSLGFSSETVERVRGFRDRHLESFRRAMAAGVAIAAGTDSGGPGYRPGSLHLELAYMAELGMGAMQVLSSATRVAAQCLGIEGGSLTPGAPADIVVFHGDPRADLKTLERPGMVIKAGQIVAGGASAITGAAGK